MHQGSAAKREQMLKFRLAATKRELESLFRFAGWSKRESKREVAKLADRRDRAHNLSAVSFVCAVGERDVSA